jgi:anti-anti-sigma regulatory factor
MREDMGKRRMTQSVYSNHIVYTDYLFKDDGNHIPVYDIKFFGNVGEKEDIYGLLKFMELSQSRHTLVDMTDAKFSELTAILALVQIREDLQDEGKELAIYHTDEMTDRALEVLKLTRQNLPAFPRKKEAIEFIYDNS